MWVGLEMLETQKLSYHKYFQSIVWIISTGYVTRTPWSPLTPVVHHTLPQPGGRQSTTQKSNFCSLILRSTHVTLNWSVTMNVMIVVLNYQKLSGRSLRVFSKCLCHCLWHCQCVFGQVMSPHHSDNVTYWAVWGQLKCVTFQIVNLEAVCLYTFISTWRVQVRTDTHLFW